MTPRQHTTVPRRLCIALAALALAVPTCATLPDGWRWDDGYTLFATVNKPTVANGKRTSHWYLQAALRCFGTIPPYSAFKLVVEKGSKVVATGRAEAQRVAGSDPFLICLALSTEKELPGPGLYTVKVFVVDGQSKQEHLARTHTVEIGALKVGNEKVGIETELAVSHHGNVLDSLLYLRDLRFPTYHQRGRAATQTYRSAELTFWLSPGEDGLFHQGRCRLTVDGKPLTRELNGILQDRTTAEVILNQLWKTGPSGYFRFQQVSLLLPLTWGKEARGSNFINLSEHPGQWELEYSIPGKVVRTWRFTVTAEGTIAPHPEQDRGLSLAKNAFFVETIVPAGGSAVDAQLVPSAVVHGGFYGRPWQSESVQTLAATLPKRGTAWPTK